MRFLPYFFLLILIASCLKRKTDNSSQTQIVDDTVSRNRIIDSSCYSKSFTKALKEFKYNQGIIFDGEHYGRNDMQFNFVKALKLNDSLALHYQNGDTTIKMKIIQSFCSSITYKVSCAINKLEIFSESGLADLQSSFWLGSETDEDENGNTFAAVDYYSSQPKVDRIRVVGVNGDVKFARVLLREVRKEFILKPK